MKKLILVRHGRSEWNDLNKFTGWIDVDLNDVGLAEAKTAGELIHQSGLDFYLAYTSVLQRANHTLEIILNVLGKTQVEIKKSWRLNERHYGALEGKNKDEIKAQYGEEQFLAWRRGYDTLPPALADNDPRFVEQINNPIFQEISSDEQPHTESLALTLKRFLPYWQTEILPAMKIQETILIVAHGNSLRALVKLIDNVSDEAIVELEIPTGAPLVYEFDDELKPIKHYYL